MLIVGSNTADNRVIEEAAHGWMLETVVCSSLQEATPSMTRQDITVAFCDEVLPDGTYRDLLAALPRGTRRLPLIVMIPETKDDEAYQKAVGDGAFDVIASPCTRQDVQWAVIRAMELTHAPRLSSRP